MQSRELLESRIKYLDAQNMLLNFFLLDTIRQEKPDTTASEEEFSLTLYRGSSASGGYVVLLQKCGALPSVHLLDDILSDHWPTEIKILAERCRVQRDKLILAAQTAV